jgi:hypothetical protein
MPAPGGAPGFGPSRPFRSAPLSTSAEPVLEWDMFAMLPGAGAPEYLATLYDAREKTIHVELDGTGSGEFTIPQGSAQATAAILAQGNLVRVRLPEVGPDYLFAFFIETGDFTLISEDEEGGELLRFGGRGILSYLGYGVAWAGSFIPGGDPPPADGLVRAYLAGTGKKAGQILFRLVQEFQSSTRPQAPIPLVMADFDYDIDSNGDTWLDTDATDEFTYKVGDPGVDIALELLKTHALTIQMDPDFGLHAYNEFGRDLHGVAFGPGIVRFEKGVNIASELRRTLAEDRVVTHDLVGGETDHYGSAVLSDAASRVTKEGFVTAFGAVTATLDAIGAADLVERQRVSDVISFPIANRRTALSLADPVTVGAVIGPDATAGFYLPGPPGSANGDFWVGDYVTVHTGTGPFDFNEASFQVVAITISRDDDNGELIVIPRLREVSLPPPAGHFLIAYCASVSQLPLDRSAHPWTLAYGIASFADPTQFPGAGAGGMSMYYREVVPGESATVATFVAQGQGNAMWVYEVAGVFSQTLSVVSGSDSLVTSGSDAPSLVSASASAESVLFGGFSLQKVAYGQNTIITTTDGTQVRQWARDNLDGSAYACMAVADVAPPYSWTGYATGTGDLTIGGTITCPGSGPPYNVMGRGYAALLMETTGFSIIQEAFNGSSFGFTFDVTLPNPPTP